MSDIVDSTIQSIRRSKQSWLKDVVRGFLNDLARQGRMQTTLRICADRVFTFGEFVRGKGVMALAQLPDWIEPFLQHAYPREPSAGIWRASLRQFLRYLREAGLLPTPDPEVAPTHPGSGIVAEYSQYLRTHRGICLPYIRDIKNYCLAFVDLLKVNDDLDWGLLCPEILHRFVVNEGRTCRRNTLQRKCTVLRSFLRYLYQQGHVTSDFSSLVMSPRVYKHEQCPRYLTAEEVDKVLAAVPRATPRGKRHYAMLLLLVAYGLRGIELIRLRLNDIDWRRQQLHIRGRKAGNSTIYPLTVSVGEAIIAYLREGRPQSTHRELFLSSRAPILPLRTTCALGRPVRDFIAKSGVRVARPGTHTFRYSCAQRLLDQGMSLKVVGDFLGHRDPGSTQRYTKIAIDQLRQVALGEDLL